MALNFHDCSEPWTSMLIYPEEGGASGPCCHFAPPRGAFQFAMSQGEGISRIWNSKPYEDIRRSIADGKPGLPPCRACPTLRYENNFGVNLDFWSGQDSLSPEQLDNARSARRHFNARNARLDSYPVNYLIRFGCRCNLRCIMCNHEKMQRDNQIEELSFEWLRQQEEAFKRAIIITVTGGEPLFIPAAKDFIGWFLGNESLKTVEMHICTNGLLLDKFLPQLKDHKVVLEVSLDSFGERYEQIRRGSSWKKVTDNLEAFLRLKAGQKPNHEMVRIHCTITRTGLPGLPDLVRWCVERGVGLHFAFMEIRSHMAMDESLLDAPQHLASLPRWERYFDESIAWLESGGDHRPGEIAQLALLRQDLARHVWAHDAAKAGHDEFLVSKYLNQRNALLNSRWRKLGRNLGIVKKLPFEE